MARKERIRLPVDCDLAMVSFWWAVEILGEPPQQLWVSPDDDALARTLFGDIAIGISECVGRFGWEVEGPTRVVWSDGGA